MTVTSAGPVVPLHALVLGAALVSAVGGCRGSDANEAAAEPAGGAITLWTDSTELFMEHPALVVGRPDRFAIHLTDLTDFAPLRSGRITLRFQPRDGGPPVMATQDAPRAPGIFGASPAFPRPGVYDLTLIVESPQATDSITVRDLRVYASAAEVPREVEGGDAGISFLKEQQWRTPGFRSAFPTTGSVAESFDAAGAIGPAAGRFADVRAPIAGMVDVEGVAGSPVPGQRVERGQVLATLTPSLGEGGSAYAEARARLREAEAEYARAGRLVAAEAAPPRRLQEAEIRLQAARGALAGLGAESLTAGGRVAVVAPVAGVVVQRSLTPGSRVEPGAPLFTIVDPSVVWLTVNVPEAHAALVSRSSGASFRLAGTERTYATSRVVSVGSVIDSLSRTLPVIYEVMNRDGSIKVGATARIQVRTGRRAEGLVIPPSAVLDEDGRPVAYVQAAGERFEKRELSLGAREGDRVLVLAGIQLGERVVIGAAYQVRLASLSTSVPAEGHAH